MALGKGWLNWLLSDERRKSLRRKSLELVAYYWDGAQPVSHEVRDVSPTGFYLFTDHRWYLGTVLAVTLQRTGVGADDPERAISVNAKVVRAGADGVGFEFLVPETEKDLRALPGLPAPLIDKRHLMSFLDRIQSPEESK
jgi:hypothetical protein